MPAGPFYCRFSLAAALNPEVPKTGEDVNASLLWGMAALLSAMAAAYAASRRRRSR
ncbi:MAG: LPXTG cell wall anchor domain-containing protein [Firmicutes bacterium]|nr:LPXTG cell wall anchor domain-containing protein [Bacillota bacterium]